MEPEDLEPRKPPAFSIGGDLSAYSVEDLQELAQTLRAEIARIEEALAAKESSRQAADSVFKS